MNKTWSVLKQRAEAAAHEAQAELNAVRARVTQLEASEAHIDKLKQDYLARYKEAQKEAHTIADNIAYRKFLDHLHGLRMRVSKQREAAEYDLGVAKDKLSVAQREQAKMEAMVERENRHTAAAAAKQEQRQLDEAGIRLYNQK
jgi:flagellar export protein FliJ